MRGNCRGWWQGLGRGRIGRKGNGGGVPRARDVCQISAKNDIGVKGCGLSVEVFNKRYMKGVKDTMCVGIP